MRRRWTTLPATVAVLLVVAAIPTAAWLAWGSGASGEPPLPPTSQADPAPRRPGPEPDPLVWPRGTQALKYKAAVTDKKGAELFTGDERMELTRTGVVTVQVLRTADGTFNRTIMRLTVRDGASPAAARDALDAIYAAGGHSLRKPSPPGVLVRGYAIAAGQPTTSYHAHYVRGRDVIRVEVAGTVLDPVDPAFAELLAEQVKAYPPDRTS
ncbi:hypothetical protein [Amycolatopsis suaedae]|uniref:Uncharacterized protein n=1 Tax=Amycolatopsis suaedae TaxID=2510978 RepID=A0A4Q7J5K4_9PSEU|nr:hypothetical protein [Amycolatopsis suaedae]RZQ62138.1 hypothetical protein EWH70_21425 [Amycolatopsis suaedae]